MMNYRHPFIAVFLVGLGLLVLRFGDRPIGTKGKVILGFFSQSPVRVQLVKWTIGVMLILFGISVV